MKIRVLILWGVFLLMAFGHITESLFQIPLGWESPVYDFSENELTKEKIELGRALFHDPILSADNTISCTSCHSQFSGFTHTDHRLSHGIDDRIGTRNAPTLMNLAWHQTFMWDGAVHHLDVQSLAPIHNPDEMGETIENVVQKLQSSTIYPVAFKNAFGDTTVTGERVLKSLSQFMLTLVSANSKYDKVQRGESSFTEKEAKGYAIFQSKCASCHAEPLFTTNTFENNGLPVDTVLNDSGRMNITKKAADSLKFKVPTLRNIEFSYPYMHDGRFRKISEVLNHYTDGIVDNPTLSQELKNKVELTADEKVELTAFLLTLSDKEFLFNRDFMYPRDFFSN